MLPVTDLSLGLSQSTIVTRSGGGIRLFQVNASNAVLDGLTISNGSYVGNSAGGMTLADGLVANCVFTRNQANRSGGALQMTGGVVSNSVFIDNWDTGNSGGSGGIQMTGGLIADSLILENRGGSSGGAVGGIRISGGEVWNSVIVSNRYGTGVGGTAGGVFIGSGAALYNSMVSANEGRGIYQGGGLSVNTTITRNSDEGLTIMGGGATNLVAWYHGDDGTNVIGDLWRIGYSLSPDLTHDPAGTGNLTNAPLFIDPGTGYGTTASIGDLRLDHFSPCIDTGANMAWMLDALDMDGNPRIVKGLYPPGPPYVDMGAYEYIPIPRGTLFEIK